MTDKTNGQPAEPRVLTVEEFRQLKALIEDWQSDRLILNSHMLAEHGESMHDIAVVILTISDGFGIEPLKQDEGKQ